jgi:hypothetical protein
MEHGAEEEADNKVSNSKHSFKTDVADSLSEQNKVSKRLDSKPFFERVALGGSESGSRGELSASPKSADGGHHMKQSVSRDFR